MDINSMDMQKIASQTPVTQIGGIQPALICPICGKLTLPGGEEAIKGKQYGIVGEAMCVECRDKLFELLYPEKAEEIKKKIAEESAEEKTKTSSIIL